ncbi:hypothetical protein QN367_11235 [Cryobacterium sp. RTS3]|uniref:hypothetical protein n=1 Tax=Cryobacterium sp. RTS3 TaxID=3048643 RepID=UPI002B2282C9|nr:hypothetical protein [Cryobacterium sp. RTS3]MEA9999675.1 hypothetical protein [Cryobacterium sp. RTS3]
MSSSRPETPPPSPDSLPPAWQVDLNSIHPLVLDKFDNPKAVPKIVSVYHPMQGWNSSMKRAVFTIGLVQDLRVDGATLVLAKWRKLERKFTLSTLDFPLN